MNGRGKIAAIGVLAALLLASCGSDDEPAAGTQTPAPTETATPTPTATATPDHSSGYPDTVRRVFVRRCTRDEPRSYCRCLIDYVAERVPYRTFSRLTVDKVPPAVQKALDDGIAECD